jgi:hypothetical protein
MGKHLSDDDLLDLLYEVVEPDSHLEECHNCCARWEAFQARRQLLNAAPLVSEDLLAQQRRRVFQRLEEHAGWRWTMRPAAALGTLGVMLLAILLSQPQPAPNLTTVASNDGQLFEEIYSMVETSEPSPMAPIHGLFEEMR